MKEPTSIKILGIDFEVRWYDKTEENASGNFGWCDCTTQVIGISSTMKPHKKADTFVHELLHALNWLFGLKDGCKEEEIARQLSTGLCAVWRDNPGVIEWLNSMLIGKAHAEVCVNFDGPVPPTSEGMCPAISQEFGDIDGCGLPVKHGGKHKFTRVLRRV